MEVTGVSSVCHTKIYCHLFRIDSEKKNSEEQAKRCPNKQYQTFKKNREIETIAVAHMVVSRKFNCDTKNIKL